MNFSLLKNKIKNKINVGKLPNYKKNCISLFLNLYFMLKFSYFSWKIMDLHYVVTIFTSAGYSSV